MTYEVYLDGEQIYAPGDPDLVILNPKLELAVNKSGSFEFDLPVTNPAYDRIKKMTSVIEVRRDGTCIFFGRCVSADRDFNNMKSILCEGELAELMDSIQEPKEFHNYTVRAFLSHLINAHNSQTGSTKKFTVGQVTVTDPNDSLYRYTNWEDTLSCIMDKLVDRLGGYIRIRHSGDTRYIDYIEDYDNTNTQVIEFGENLLDYAENLDASEIATRIIPLGARLEESSIEALEEYTTIKSVNNNVPYVESASAVKSFGIITKTVHFDDVTVPANLKTKAQKYLEDIQYENLCLTCKAIDLNMADGSIESIKLGDSIRVLSPPHGMDRYFPVTALTLYPDKPEENTVTLGTDVKAGLSERTAGDSRALNSRINDIPPLSQALAMAKDNATELITAATTGHVVTRPNEILIMDTADTATAKKVWRWNANGLGYSKTGYNGQYGLAMTIDGAIVADYITTGKLNAQRIQTGVLSDARNTNYWNMDTGEMNIVAKSFRLSSGATIDSIAEGKANSALGTAKSYADTTASSKANAALSSAKSYADTVAASEAEKAVDAQTQADIFNRLTNNGKEQGIYLQSGKLYLNATYIKSGTVSADYIKAGTLKDSGGNMTWNLGTGAISAKKLSINSTNFTLTTAGNMTAKNASINGTVTAESGDNKVVMGSGRLSISYKGKEMGMVGANGLAGYTDKAGLNFDLEVTGDYMTWAAQNKANSTYIMKWTYAQDSSFGFSGGMLNAGCDIDMRYYKLRNVSWPDGGITGTCNFVRVISMSSDGTVASWSNGNRMQFKNGILISGVFS